MREKFIMNTHEQLINADAYVVVTPTVETTAYVYEGITKSIVNLSTSSSPYFLTEDNMFGRAGRRMGKIITTTELLGTETATLVVPRSEFGVVGGKGDNLTEKDLAQIVTLMKDLPKEGNKKAHMISYEEYMEASAIHVFTLPYGESVEQLAKENPKDMAIVKSMLATRQGGIVGDKLFYYTNDYVEEMCDERELPLMNKMITKVFGTLLATEVLRGKDIHEFLFDIPERDGSNHQFGQAGVEMTIHSPVSINLTRDTNNKIMEVLQNEVVATILQMFNMRRTTVDATPTIESSKLRDVAVTPTNDKLEIKLTRSTKEEKAGDYVKIKIPIYFEYSKEAFENVIDRLNVFFDVTQELTKEVLISLEKGFLLPESLTLLSLEFKEVSLNGSEADELSENDEKGEVSNLFKNPNKFDLIGATEIGHEISSRVLANVLNANFYHSSTTILELKDYEGDVAYAVKGNKKHQALNLITGALQIAEQRSYLTYVVQRFINEKEIEGELDFLENKDLVNATADERNQLKGFVKALMKLDWKDELNSVLPLKDFKPSKLGSEYTVFYDRKSFRALEAVSAYLNVRIGEKDDKLEENESIILQETIIDDYDFVDLVELIAMANLLVRPFAFASCDKEVKILEMGYFAIEEGGVTKLMQYAIVHRDSILTMSDLDVLNPDILENFFESDDVFELAFAMFSFMNWVLETTQCNVHVFSLK